MAQQSEGKFDTYDLSEELMSFQNSKQFIICEYIKTHVSKAMCLFTKVVLF